MPIDAAVRREVILPVDREAAWHAITDPAELATWLADEVELEVEVGRRGWLRWHDGDRRQATVEEVVELRRVVLRWGEPGGSESIVELVLDDTPEGTRLVVLELPVEQLEAVGTLLDQGPQVIGGPQLRPDDGPRMAVLA